MRRGGGSPKSRRARADRNYRPHTRRTTQPPSYESFDDFDTGRRGTRSVFSLPGRPCSHRLELPPRQVIELAREHPVTAHQILARAR